MDSTIPGKENMMRSETRKTMITNFNKCKVDLLARVPRFARRVQPVYKLLNWWLYINRRSRGEYCMPSVRDIEDILYMLVERIQIDDTTENCSYGLHVQIEIVPPNSRHLLPSMWLQIEDSDERQVVRQDPKTGKVRCIWRKVSKQTVR